MQWFRNPFRKTAPAARLCQQTALADLQAIQKLPSETQRKIAADIGSFISMAGLNNGLLETLFTAAVKERQDAVADGASWSEDPRWAIATLKEAWCGAKLGKARGVISKDAADSIVRKIEAFAFDSKHAG